MEAVGAFAPDSDDLVGVHAGVMPLFISSARVPAQNAVGTGVLGGMVTATYWLFRTGRC